MSQVVIFSKVASCTSQPVAFIGHLSTHGCLTSLRNKPQKQASETSLRLVMKNALCHCEHMWWVLANPITYYTYQQSALQESTLINYIDTASIAMLQLNVTINVQWHLIVRNSTPCEGKEYQLTLHREINTSSP